MLEAQKHEHSLFVTLTYNKEHYPIDGSVDPRELQLYLKRLRELVKPTKIRFFAVGEYGDKKGRAHYHLALFGLPECMEVSSAWGKGNVHVGSLTVDSAAYIVSYVCKSMTRKEDKRLDGRHPEFARMSLKPGIGAFAVKDFKDSIASCLDLGTGEYYGLPNGDVPSVFRFNGRHYPLGRYLRSKLREALGFPKTEPVACGELRNYRRYVDLSSAGRRGWKVREERRLADSYKAQARHQLYLDRRGYYETA